MIRSINAFRALALCAGLIPAAALAQDAARLDATTLAAGGLFGGSTQTVASCFLYNAGNSAVSVTAEIVRQRTGPVPLIFNDCGTLAAGSICLIQALANPFTAHACKVVFSPASKLVRGSFEMQNIGPGDKFTVLTNVELR